MYFYVQENLREWLLNPDGVDQFVIRYMNETEIFWNSFIGNKPKLEFKRTVRSRLLT